MRVPRLLADLEHLAVKLRERTRSRRAVLRGIHSGHLEVVVEGRRARRPVSARAINPLRLLRGVHAHVSDDHLLHRGAAAVPMYVVADPDRGRPRGQKNAEDCREASRSGFLQNSSAPGT